MSKWKFDAVLLADDKRTGYSKGTTFDPKGFYYNGKNVILVGSVGAGHAIRLSFPVDIVEVKVTKGYEPPKQGVRWGIWMKAQPGLNEGWWCGSGVRQNDFLCRTPDSDDSDWFDSEEAADAQADEFRGKGWPCEVKKLSKG